MTNSQQQAGLDLGLPNHSPAQEAAEERRSTLDATTVPGHPTLPGINPGRVRIRFEGPVPEKDPIQ